jgi:hypothetical protein
MAPRCSRGEGRRVRGRREGLDRTCLVGLQGLRSIVLAAACLFAVLASAPVALAAPNLPPTINSFDPNAGIPGQTVTVSGPHVGDATTAVAFNGVPAARFSVLSPSRVSAVVPLAATTGPVSLTTPAGTATSSGSFTVPPPVLVSVQPNQAVVGQSVTVWGFNFAGVTEVRFNGALVKSFTIVSPIQIQAIVPNDATTGPVTVTAASGTASSFLPFTLIQAPQTVSFSSAAPTAATAFGATYTPIATASSGLPVALTIDPASTSVCAISGGTVSFLAGGNCTIAANQAGSRQYLPALQVTQSFQVAKASQAVSFTSAAPTDASVGGQTYTPSANATSQLPVALSIDPLSGSACSMTAGVVSFGAAGTCVIDANQAGNVSWNAAPQAQQNFTVSRGQQTISFAAILDQRLDAGSVALSASASSGLPVELESTTPDICSVSGASAFFIRIGTCSIRASQSGSADWLAAADVSAPFAITYENVIAPGQQATATSGGSAPATLQIPSDAFPSGGSLEIDQVANPDPAATADTEGPTVKIVSSAQPANAVTLSVPYDPSANGPADSVTLAWWSEDTNSWQPVYTTFDPTAGQLQATIPHFSFWSWIKKKVLGVSGDTPSCDGSAPSWADVSQTAAGEFGGIVGSCVGTTSNGALQVRVISDHNGFSYVVFQEEPKRFVVHGVDLPPVHNADGWYALVPSGEVVEADFDQPTGSHATPLYGYGGRDGLTYASDTLLSAVGFIVGIPAADVIEPAVLGCYELIIDAADSQVPADESAALDCIWGVIKAVKGGIADTAAVSDAVKTALSKVSFWLNLGEAARDFAIAVFNSGAEPTVVDATLSPAPPAPPSLTISTTSVNPGDSIQIGGMRYAANEQITFTLDGTTLSATIADSSGSFSATITVPASTATGAHTLTVDGPTSGPQDIPITVGGSGGGTTPPPADYWKSAAAVTAGNNGDSTLPSNPFCTVPPPPNPCSIPTAYGLVAGGSQVELNGSTKYIPLNRPFILPIPFSSAFFTEDTSPPYTGGVNLFYYSDFPSSITATKDALGNVVSYTVTATPDARFRDASGNLQSFDANSLVFSPNTKWIVAASPAYMVRLSLDTLQTFDFGLPTEYDLGQAPNYRMAISNDGRYVAFGQPYNGSSLFIEDLSTCSPPAPNTVVSNMLVTGNQCQTIDVSGLIKAVVPGYVLATPWQFSDSDDTLVVYAGYKDANGITHQARVTLTSAAG